MAFGFSVSRRGLLLAGLAATLLPQAGWADDYPSRTITIVAPFSAGGGVDIVARLLAEKMSKTLGQQVIVENKPGATGNIGAEIVAKSAPDGYTLLMGNVATSSINGSIFKNLGFDPINDFSAITLVARVPEVLVVNPKLPAKSVQDLIALGKQKPGQLTYGSAGIGSPPHLAAALFALMADINIRHIPYSGSSPALTDLMGGRIDMYFSNVLSAMPHVASGKLRALGVTGSERSDAAPDVPTIAESGLSGYEAYNWYGLLVPKETPQPIIDKLHDAIVAALHDKDVEQNLASGGAEIVGGTPAEFDAYIASEAQKYKEVVEKAHITIPQ
jgi:tripartite-type tricarboxylate transporter receptor subunit TctC